MPCKICGNSTGNRAHSAREMMYGMGGSFTYVECASCGCISLAEVPPDLERYYPSHYSGFSGSEGGIRGLAKKLRVHSYFGKGHRLGKWIAGRYPRPDLAAMAKANLAKDCRILDVGCGGGKLLLELAELGYKNLTGVDPFIEEDVCHHGYVEIRKAEISRLQETEWDFIMFHHSFEHIPSQVETLKAVQRRLSLHGVCMLRIPVAGWAWEHYGTNWVQLDAPRHLFLHTEKSLHHLARQAGLWVVSVEYDSFEFQFWGSELYQRGIRMTASGVPRRFFTSREMREFKRRSLELNAARQGDQAVFRLARVA